MITPEHQQELLARAYVQAVAGHAGMSTSAPDPDYGIDLTIHDVKVRITKETGERRYTDPAMPDDLLRWLRRRTNRPNRRGKTKSRGGSR